MITELPADAVERLRELRMTLHRHHRALGDPPGFRTRDEDDAWQAWSAKARATVEDGRGAFLAHHDGDRITGFAYVVVLGPEGLGRPVVREVGVHAELATLVVADGARGRRIGEQLMAHARTWSRARGAGTMHVIVRSANEGALRFYRREGAEPAFTTMLMEL